MAKLSEKKKVELLESAVLRNDVAEVRRLYTEHGGFEFTARALGLACRFSGPEMVKALVENGAAFQYDNDTPFKTKYGVVYERKDASYPANYGTMISLKSFEQVRWSETVTRGIDPQYAFFDPGTYSSMKEREPISEDERVEIVRYVMDKGVRGFDRGEVLYFAILSGYNKIAQCMIERGARIVGIYKFSPSNRLTLREELLDALTHMSEEEQLAILDLFAKVLPTDGRDFQKKITINAELARDLHSRPLVKYLFEAYETPDIRDPGFLLKRAMETNDAALMAGLLKYNCVKSVKKRDELIGEASKGCKTQVLAALLDYKNRTANVAKEAEARERRERSELSMSTTSKAYIKKTWGYEKLPDGTIAITGYKGSDVDVIVPERIEDALVTEIGEYAFSPAAKRLTADKIRCREQIQTIVLPDGIRRIGAGAFEKCKELSKFILPKNIKIIEKYTFAYCGKLANVTISQGIEEIRDGAFACCGALTDISMPDSVFRLGSQNNAFVPATTGVFYGCSGLLSVQLSKNLTEIGVYTFASCHHLTGIEIPKGVKGIGSRAFSGCNGLKEIRIPDCVTTIYSYAFADCAGLTRVTLPEGLKKIEMGAFEDCSSLSEIVLPGSLTKIETRVFARCSGLISVTLREGIKAVENNMFENCSKLTRIVLPKGLERIGIAAFSGCSGLTDITMPESLAKIDPGAFKMCSSLTKVTLPAGVKMLGFSAFSECTSLKEVVLPEGLTDILDVFAGCSSLTNVVLPKGLRRIDGTFRGCGKLTSITIPEGVEEIGNSAFEGCGSLMNIVLPQSVTAIGEGAFQDCCEGLTIRCVKGSYAEAYAEQNKIKLQMTEHSGQ